MNTNFHCAGKYSVFQCKLGGCSVYPSCTNPDKNVKKMRKINKTKISKEHMPHSDNNRYWIGKQKVITFDDWNDPANWSDTSNGIGGASAPTSETNVYLTIN